MSVPELGITATTETFDRVVRNQIHFCGKPSGVLREKMGLLVSIVYTSDQNIFEGETLVFVSDKVIAS